MQSIHRKVISINPSIWCRLPESNWRPFHYELSILVYIMELRSKSCIESCIENSLKSAKKLHPSNSKKHYYECINEDIEMKNAIAMLAFVSATTFAQTTYYNNPNGTPLGTAQQVGNTTYYNNPNGTPLGTAQQVGNTTYYNNPNGTPIGHSTISSANPTSSNNSILYSNSTNIPHKSIIPNKPHWTLIRKLFWDA